MARRAASALAVILALAAVALPVALIGAAAPATAATGGANQPPATVTITRLSPRWAGAGATVTVTGIVTNTSPTEERLIVQLLDSSTPVSSVAELQQSAAGLYGLAGLILPTATWKSGLLRQGASANWSLQLPTTAMTSFGVYPIAAQVENVFGTPLNTTESFLPYVPAKNSPYSSTEPTAQKVSWVWPLIDQPLLDEPWQDVCTGAQAAALAQNLSGGRLDQLLGAATAPVSGAATAAAQAQAVTTNPGRPAKSASTHGQQQQSLASYDGLTWALDPALVANVTALAHCGARQPQWSQAASAWLAKLKTATAGQPEFVTAYGDPDVATLMAAGHAADVQRSYSYGRSQASQIMGRNLSPAPTGTAPTGSTQAAGLAWSADAQVSYGTLENLAAVDNVGTVLLNSSAFSAAPTTVFRTLAGNGSYLNVLLASKSLTSLLGGATSAPGSAFASLQDFLAETALMTQQNSAAPIIVAPPERWQPPPGLASDLLSATASAPWLSPASLTSLTGAKSLPTVQPPGVVSGSTTLSQTELDQLNGLDLAVTQLQLLRTQPDPDLYLAVATAESSAYEGRSMGTALAMIASLTNQIAQQQARIHIVAENRITLGGLRGSVPVSVDNRLGYPVQVQLRLSYDTTGGTTVTASSPAVLTVPRYTAETIKLRITAAQTGSTTITMTLANRAGQALAVQPVRMTVQTTQVGLLGLIIFGAALGVFLLASAARAMRRGGPRPSADEADSPVPNEDERSGQGTEEAAPGTVVAEPSELGTAPTPRPR